MPGDQSTTLASLRKEVKQFVAERQWEKFHSPKNISMALAVEAAELMEHFQWLSGNECSDLNDEKLAAIGEELADVLCYTVAMANTLDIDIAKTFHEKMDRNRQKYPVEEIRGRFGHDDPNPVVADSTQKEKGQC